MNDDAPPDFPEPPFDIAPVPTFKEGRRYADDDIAPILAGTWRLPNMKPVDAETALGRIASYDPGQWTPGKVKVDAHPYAQSGIYLVGRGAGMAITTSGKAYTFTLCEHQFISTLPSGFDSRRGWHPGYCAKCGVDMSTDSSD